jgi:hypothetical protein
MTPLRLLRVPGFVRLGVKIDMAPSGLWLALLVAAAWPTLWWTVRRMLDGSDEPLGALALAALGLLAWRHRKRWRASPRLGWLALALVGTAASSVLLGYVPSLASSLLGLLAIGAGLAAFLPAVVPTAPVIGLATLSLPLLASLQFYAGYPLRLVTAEAASWLLAPGFDVERSGTALRIDGQLVIVDAPCSGVQMRRRVACRTAQCQLPGAPARSQRTRAGRERRAQRPAGCTRSRHPPAAMAA